jgi:type I site-specific restriction endonuclease
VVVRAQPDLVGPRGRAAGLTDRRSEREALDRLVEAVRDGQSRALVVRGDPGVGKTEPKAGYITA